MICFGHEKYGLAQFRQGRMNVEVSCGAGSVAEQHAHDVGILGHRCQASGEGVPEIVKAKSDACFRADFLERVAALLHLFSCPAEKQRVGGESGAELLERHV